MLKIKALISRVVLLPVAGVYQKNTINSGRQWEGAGLALDGSSPGAMPNAPGAVGAGWQPEGVGLQRRFSEIPPECQQGCLRRASQASLLENL